MRNIDYQDRSNIKIQNDLFKKRLKVAPPEEIAIWGASIAKLTTLGDHVISVMDKLSDDELKDFLKLYNTANLLHDIKKPKEERKHIAQVFDKLLKQNYDFYEAFAEQIANAPTYKEYLRMKKNPDEKISASDLKDDIDLITVLVNHTNSIINDFEMKYMFSTRDIDIQKIDFVKNASNKIQRKRNFELAQKEYENVHMHYASLKSLYQDVIRFINECLFVGESQNGEEQLNTDLTYGEIDEIKKELLSIRNNFIVLLYRIDRNVMNDILDGNELIDYDGADYGTITLAI